MIPKLGCFFRWRFVLRFRSHGMVKRHFKQKDKNSNLVGRCFVIFYRTTKDSQIQQETVGAISRWTSWHALLGVVVGGRCETLRVAFPRVPGYLHSKKPGDSLDDLFSACGRKISSKIVSEVTNHH